MNKAPKKHNNSQVQGLVLVMGVFPASIKKSFSPLVCGLKGRQKIPCAGNVAMGRSALLQQGARNEGPQRSTRLSQSWAGLSHM